MKKKLSLLLTFMLCFVIGAWADTYTVAGAVLGGDGSESAGFFFSKWEPNESQNDMEEAEGVFVKKYENLELNQCRILFKVVKNHSWGEAFPDENYEVWVEKAGKYDLTITFSPESRKVNALLEPKEGDSGTTDITSMEIRGNFPGMSWYAEDAVPMSLVPGSTVEWKAIVENVEIVPTTYVFKAFANHDTNGYQLPEYGNATYEFNSGGTYNLVFIANTQTHTLTLTPQKVGEGEEPEQSDIPSREIRGTFPGMSWWEEGAVPMESLGGTAWGVIVENVVVEAETYEYKAFANHTTEGFQLPEEGNASFTFGSEQYPAGKYNLRFIADTEVKRLDCIPMKVEEPEQPATITKVQICGATDKAWENRIDFDLDEADPNTYFKVLDATAYMDDVEFKLVVNGNEWIGTDRIKSIDDLDGLLSQGTNSNFLLKNSDGRFQTYGFKAVWGENPNAAAGWTLQVQGIEKRPVTEVTWTVAGNNETLFGTTWDTTAAANDMVKDKDGLYKWEKADVELTAGDVMFKVVKNHSWNVAYPEKNYILSIAKDGKYTVTITFNEKTEEVAATAVSESTPEPTVITKVVFRGGIGGDWDKKPVNLELMDAAPAQLYTYYNVLDATDYTDDVEFKLVINDSKELGIGQFNKIDDPYGLIQQKGESGKSLVLKNSNGKYRKYDVKATWKQNPDVAAGWTLEVLGTELRTSTADTWTVAGSDETLFGKSWMPEWAANDMVKDKDGLYKWEKTEAVLAKGDVKFKVVKNHSWTEAYPENDYVLPIAEDGQYTVTITFNAGTKEVLATATKTGGAVIPDAQITSVQLPGDWNWSLEKGEYGVEPYLVLTKGEGNVWTGVLDLTEVTADQKFKLAINKKEWLGLNELTLNAGELVAKESDKDNNFILLNGTSGYQTYDVTAIWEANSNAKLGWTLIIAGKEERVIPTEPVYTLVGDETATFLGQAMTAQEANNLNKIYEGFYQKEYKDVNLEAGRIKVWVVKDGDMNHLLPNTGGFTLEIREAGIYDLTFNFHSEEGALRGMAEKKAEPLTITRMDIVGDFTGGWPKETGDGSLDLTDATKMTQSAVNPAVWTLKIENFQAEAQTYNYKATANGKWGVYELPSSGNNNWVFGSEEYPAGKYDLLFKANTDENTLTLIPTLREVEVVILGEDTELAENETLPIEDAFTKGDTEVEDGETITINAYEPKSEARKRAARAFASDDISIKYKPTDSSDCQPAEVTINTTETGYQFDLNSDQATAINARGFAIEAHKPIVVSEVTIAKTVVPCANSLNIEQFVLDNILGSTTNAAKTAFNAALAECYIDIPSYNALDSLNDENGRGRNEEFLGLQLKKQGDYVKLQLKKGKMLNVKFGCINDPVDVSIDGVVDAEKQIAAKKDGNSTFFTLEAGEADREVQFTTTAGNAVVFKQIMIGEEIAPVTLPARVKYELILADGIENGTVEFAATSYTKSKAIMTVKKGDEVTITATPAEGYHLKSVTVTGLEADLWVTVTDGKFLMPEADMVVNVTFEKDIELADGFYLASSMNSWTPTAADKLEANTAAVGEEYLITKDLDANTEMKVVKIEAKAITTWYPADNGNYVVEVAGKYDIYFRPNADGGDDWYEKVLFVTAASTDIHDVKAAAQKDAQIYNLNGQRISKTQKGLYIVHGRKVLMK